MVCFLVPTEGAESHAVSVPRCLRKPSSISYQSYLLTPKIVDSLPFGLFRCTGIPMLTPLPRSDCCTRHPADVIAEGCGNWPVRRQGPWKYRCLAPP